jgi:elongation factor 1 alpha-like protein
MDIAVNKFETEKARFTILDAPGHRDFIPNMIAGASQADFAVLVIDSSTGAFEAGFHLRGQTKEHTLLVRSMGVQRIIVAVNKLDSVEWSHERFEEIEQQMTQFLTQAGFASKNISFIPCSGLTGGNIVKKPKSGLIPWYSGPTLVEELGRVSTLNYAYLIITLISSLRYA